MRSYFALAPDLRSGKTSPSEFLRVTLATLDAREPTLKAFVSLARETSIAAAKASDERWRAGKPLSPVDGMPIGIKDIIDTANMPTEMGSEIYRGWQPRSDAPVVMMLKRAGEELRPIVVHNWTRELRERLGSGKQ